MRNLNLFIAAIVIILITPLAPTSCAQLTVHDMRVCSIGPGNDDPNAGAACDQVYSSNPVLLTEAQWQAMAPGQFCVSAQDYGFIKVEIEEACSQLKCSYEQIQAMKLAFKQIDGAYQAALRGQP